MREFHNFGLAVLVCSAGALAMQGPARAELVVTDTTVGAVAKGASFDNDAEFNVPAGKWIKFLKKPENTTHEIDGPYKGTLANYSEACGWWDHLRGKCKGGNGDEVGGTRAYKPVTGGTRSISPE
jgi:hypothetical protein